MEKTIGFRTLQRVLLAATFLSHAASGQPEAPLAGAAEDGKFHVKGVLISERSRSALVNGQLVRENERIADVEVVEISEHDVKLRRGGYDLTVLVGGSASWSHASPSRQSVARSKLPAPTSSPDSFESRHTVASGETLSGIAERYVAPGRTLVGTMQAIFEANPHAFFGDMHSLRAGATLALPEPTSPIPGTRMANNVDNNEPSPHRYGPVREGETLSAIAAKLADAEYTGEQLMTALFVKNPHAFGGNINLLYSGAELRLPDPIEIKQRTPDAAAAEIARHMTAWNERRRAPRLQAALAPLPRSSLPQR